MAMQGPSSDKWPELPIWRREQKELAIKKAERFNNWREYAGPVGFKEWPRAEEAKKLRDDVFKGVGDFFTEEEINNDIDIFFDIMEKNSYIFERSQTAEWYLEQLMSTTNARFSIGDAKVHEVLRDWGINSPVFRKTPDILILDGNTVYVGDVAVTRDLKNVLQIKHEKYEDMRKEIQMENPTYFIAEYNFILDEELSNLPNTLGSLKNLFPGMEINASTRESFIASMHRIKVSINKVYEQTRDRSKMAELEATMKTDVTVMPRNEVKGDGLPWVSWKPIRSEKQLFDMAMRNARLTEISDMDDASILVEFDKIENEIMMAAENCDTDGGSLEYMKTKTGEFKYKTPTPFIANTQNQETLSGLELIRDYMQDLDRNNSKLAELFPSRIQMRKMIDIRESKIKYAVNISENGRSSKKEFIESQISRYGQTSEWYCPLVQSHNYNMSSLAKEKHDLSQRYNKPRAPQFVHPTLWERAYESVERGIEVFNCITRCESTNITWDMPDSLNGAEREKMLIEANDEIFKLVNKLHGTVLASNIRKFASDCAYLSRKTKRGLYYSLPVNRSSIIIIHCSGNMGNNNTHVNFSTMVRFKRSDDEQMKMYSGTLEYYGSNIDHVATTEEYMYVHTKIHKVQMAVLARLSNIDYEMRTQIMAMHCMVEDDNRKIDFIRQYATTTTLIAFDLHQNPSIILDLMKYLVSMPYSKYSSMIKLLYDKLNIVYKTNMDIFLARKVIDFCRRNWKMRNEVRLPRQIRVSGKLMPESYGITGKFNSFTTNYIFNDFTAYTSECQLLFQIRPKKLYNDQEMDKSAMSVVLYNHLYEESIKTSKWPMGHDIDDFPFDMHHAYSNDAVYYATKLECQRSATMLSRQRVKVNRSINEQILSNLSMRGGCKELTDIMTEVRRNRKLMINEQGDAIRVPKHTMRKLIDQKSIRTSDNVARSQTALLSGLELIDDSIRRGDSEKCTVIGIQRSISHMKQTYNITPKEQRGGARPIGSGSASTKQKLRLVELTASTLASHHEQNLLAKGRNRAAKLASLNSSLIDNKSSQDYKKLYHIVMDQSKFSEGDNTDKFITMFNSHDGVPDEVKGNIEMILRQNNDRREFFKNIPGEIHSDDVLKKYIGETDSCIIGKVGWVQGMLNHTATLLHTICVEWIVDVFNRYYSGFDTRNEKRIMCKNLINSDDSYAGILVDSDETARDFYKFMVSMKKMFRLLQNEKKSYMSESIGEVIQLFVVNGNVINIWAKSAIQVYNNNMGVDIVKDNLSAIGALQTLCRQGAPETFLAYLRSELNSHISRYYLVGKGKYNDISYLGIDRGKLPLEMGGWPSYITTFELANAGTFAQLNYIRRAIEKGDMNQESRLIMAAIISNLALAVRRRSAGQDPKNAGSLLYKTELTHMKSPETYIDDEIREITNKENIPQQPDIEETYEYVLGNEVETNAGDEFTRSMLNPFNFIISISKKVSKTVQKLNTYGYEGSGLGGIYKVDDDVQMLVADIRDNASAYILSLSESGFFKDNRKKAIAQAAIAHNTNVKIGMCSERVTLLNAFYKLKRYSDTKLDELPVLKMKIHELMMQLLLDPTSKAEITYNIVSTVKLAVKRQITHVVANEVPPHEEGFELSNQMQAVLIDLVRPGYLMERGYHFRYPERLEGDKLTLCNKYPGWLKMKGPNTLVAAKAIYYKHLNIRRQRWHVGPSIDRSSIYTFLTGVYSTCIDGFNQYTHRVERNKHTYDVVRRAKFNRVMGAFEVYSYLKYVSEYNEEDIREKLYTSDDEGSEILFVKYCDSPEFIDLYNTSWTHEKELLAAVRFVVTGESDLLTSSSKDIEYRINWKLPQTKTASGSWIGPFSVEVSRGNYFIEIDGEPGKIAMIRSNTREIQKVVGLIYHFLTKINFQGHNKPRTRAEWGKTGVMKSELDMLDVISSKVSYLVYNEYESSYITDDTNMALNLIGKGAVVIPINTNMTRKPTTVELLKFDEFYIDERNLKLYGVIKSNVVIHKFIKNLKLSVFGADMSSVKSILKVHGHKINDLQRLGLTKDMVRNQVSKISKEIMLELQNIKLVRDNSIQGLVRMVMDMDLGIESYKGIEEYDDKMREIMITQDEIIGGGGFEIGAFDEESEEDILEIDLKKELMMRSEILRHMNLPKLRELVQGVRDSFAYKTLLFEKKRIIDDYHEKLNALNQASGDWDSLDAKEREQDIVREKEDKLAAIDEEAIVCFDTSEIPRERTASYRTFKAIDDVIDMLLLAAIPDYPNIAKSALLKIGMMKEGNDSSDFYSMLIDDIYRKNGGVIEDDQELVDDVLKDIF